jgi:Cdc25 family phosphatase
MDDDTLAIDSDAPPVADENAVTLTPDDYIAPLELHRLMESHARPLVIVDMRDEDRKIGHIRGSTNLPSKSLTDAQLENIYSAAPMGALVVFHCMFSQTRGPGAYVRFMKLMRRWTLADGGIKQLEARVLRGGFRGWRRHVGTAYPDTMVVPAVATRIRRTAAAAAASSSAANVNAEDASVGRPLPTRAKRDTR